MATQFRKAHWGMTPSEVRRIESSEPLLVNEDSLIFDTTILGAPCSVIYNFERGRLVGGGYLIDNADDAEDVDVFFRLSETLTQKYGEPQRDVNWRNPWRAQELENYRQVGKLVAAGELKVRQFWNTEDTAIALALTEQSDAYNAYVILNYSDRESLGEQWEIRQQADIDLL